MYAMVDPVITQIHLFSGNAKRFCAPVGGGRGARRKYTVKSKGKYHTAPPGE